MKIKRFTATNMQAGLKMISEALGPEAVILSNKRIGSGLEIVAGVDEQDYEMFATQLQTSNSEEVSQVTASGIIKANPSQPLDVDTMTQLLGSMSDKNQQVFSAVSPNGQPSQAPRPAVNRAQPSIAPAPQAAEITTPHLEPTTKSRASNDDLEAFQMIRQEIDGLKHLLKEQTEQLKEPVGQMNPQYERLEARLQTMGFTRSIIGKLMSHYDREDSVDNNWRKIMGRLSSAIPAPLYEPTANGGVFAINGPTGAGKTTTIAKLAAHAVKDFGMDAVAIVSLDWFQVGGQDILKSVAQILNVDFYPLTEGQSLADKLAELSDKKVVFIDTSGSKEAMQYWNTLITQEQLSREIQTMLVIPATMHPSAMTQFIQNYTTAQFDSVVLTKLDESASFGGVLEPVLKHHWPIWYCTDGQNIPQDIEMCQVKSLVKRLMKSLHGEKTTMENAGEVMKAG